MDGGNGHIGILAALIFRDVFECGEEVRNGRILLRYHFQNADTQTDKLLGSTGVNFLRQPVAPIVEHEQNVVDSLSRLLLRKVGKVPRQAFYFPCVSLAACKFHRGAEYVPALPFFNRLDNALGGDALHVKAHFVVQMPKSGGVSRVQGQKHKVEQVPNDVVRHEGPRRISGLNLNAVHLEQIDKRDGRVVIPIQNCQGFIRLLIPDALQQKLRLLFHAVDAGHDDGSVLLGLGTHILVESSRIQFDELIGR